MRWNAVKVFLFALLALAGCAGSEERAENLRLRIKLGDLLAREQYLQRQVESLQQENLRLRREVLASRGEAAQLKRDIENLRSKLSGSALEVAIREGSPAIILPEKVSFQSGKADITRQGKSALRKVAAVIKSDFPNSLIRIEGHTDSDPVRKTKNLWKSNWELGAARALSVLHYLEHLGVRPERMHAVTFSMYRPRAKENSPAGKQKNRRVEIVILKEKEP